jgi:hypothetical protein
MNPEDHHGHLHLRRERNKSRRGQKRLPVQFGGQATLPDDFITPIGRVLNYFVTGYDNNNLYEIIVYGH